MDAYVNTGATTYSAKAKVKSTSNRLKRYPCIYKDGTDTIDNGVKPTVKTKQIAVYRGTDCVAVVQGDTCTYYTPKYDSISRCRQTTKDTLTAHDVPRDFLMFRRVIIPCDNWSNFVPMFVTLCAMCGADPVYCLPQIGESTRQNALP